jgi:hypothetical protein
MTETPWESYGPGNDPRCEHCMMHCGFEPSAALGINAGLADNLKMLAWTCCPSAGRRSAVRRAGAGGAASPREALSRRLSRSGLDSLRHGLP